MRDVMGLLTCIKKSYAEGLTSVWWCLEKETSGNNEVQRRPSDWSPHDGIGFLIRKDTGELALFTPPPVPSVCVCVCVCMHMRVCMHENPEERLHEDKARKWPSASQKESPHQEWID